MSVLSVPYTPMSEDVFFFDTNIWLHLCASIGNYGYNKQRQCSRLLNDISINGNKILLTSLILSEFINAYLKMEFYVLAEKNKWSRHDYKNLYRNTPECQSHMDCVKQIIQRQILPKTTMINDRFSRNIIDDIFKNFKNNADFNDYYFLELARSNKLIIVTDDQDFTNICENITVIKL